MQTGKKKGPGRPPESATLPDDVQRAVAFIKTGSPLPSRAVRYVGKIKVEELVDGEKGWSLEDQIERLPDLRTESFSSGCELIRKVMEILDQGDEGFAQLLGIPVATVRAWKQGAREPSGAGKRLLEVAVQIPGVMLYAISGSDEALNQGQAQ